MCQCIPLLWKNKLGSDSCLQRQRGRPLPCRKLTKSSERSGDVDFIPLELHYTMTTYPLLGSDCPAHEPLVVRGVISVPKAGGVEFILWKGHNMSSDHLPSGGRPQLYVWLKQVRSCSMGYSFKAAMGYLDISAWVTMTPIDTMRWMKCGLLANIEGAACVAGPGE